MSEAYGQFILCVYSCTYFKRSSNTILDENDCFVCLPFNNRLSVGTTFDKQVQEAVMDLTGDDSDLLKKQQSMMKWDKKKKKYVSMGKVSCPFVKRNYILILRDPLIFLMVIRCNT